MDALPDNIMACLVQQLTETEPTILEPIEPVITDVSPSYGSGRCSGYTER